MHKKFTASIAGASIFITLTGLISKGLGFFREIIFASNFGLTHDFDIYLVAAVLPLTINTIILYLAQNYLIPFSRKFEKVSMDTEFIQFNIILFILGGLILAALLYIFSVPIIRFYIPNSDIYATNKALVIFKLFLISIPINCATSVLIAYLQLNFEFKYPAYSQLLLNISFIIIVLLFSSSVLILAIPFGYNTGLILQLLFLMKKSNFRLKFVSPTNLFKNLKRFSPVTLLFIILIESIGQLYTIVDRYFYGEVPVGGIAALNYAQTVFLLPLSILSIAMSTAIFPKFSEYLSKNNMNELKYILYESVKINAVIFIPISILFFCYGDILLRIFFQRGNFSLNDTIITYETLKYLSLSFLFYSIYSIINKLLYSLRLVKNLLYITVIGILIKIILNFVFVVKYEQYGLALSTSLSYLFFFLSSLFLLYKNISFNKSIFLMELIFHLSNGFISLFISQALKYLMPGQSRIIEIFLFISIFSLNLFLIKHSVFNTLIRVKDLINWSLNGKSK